MLDQLILQVTQQLSHAGGQWHHVQTVRKCHSLPAYNFVHLVHIKKQDTGHTVWKRIYPAGRNTLQPMFIFRHLQHTARTNKPSISSRLHMHATFIDFDLKSLNKPRTRSLDRL